MRELSLFSGAGGGLLGTKLLGWENVGYVEFNDYCQQILKQRIKDGYLDEAPIFSDIRAFNSEGYAKSYKGLVDVITAGFPCQPFSIAGKQQGADDPRNMWPATLACIRTIRPKLIYLENVSALLVSGYFGTVLGGLAESGYNIRWRILSAAELGAPHLRKRVWIIAYTDKFNDDGRRFNTSPIFRERSKQTNIQRGKREVCDTASQRLPDRSSQPLGRPGSIEESKRPSEQIPNSNKNRCNEGRKGEPSTRCNGIIGNTWWNVEPGLGRVANGVAKRVDRLKAIGNGQVPAVVATAFKFLINQTT